MKIFQKTEVFPGSEQSPREYAEAWFRAYAVGRFEEPVDELLQAACQGRGDFAFVDGDVTWMHISEECGGEYCLIGNAEGDDLLWTEASTDEEYAFLCGGVYDEAGYNIRGFNREGQHRNGTGYDEDGYDHEGTHRDDMPEPLPDELAVYDPTYSWCETVEDHKRNGRYDEALSVLDGCMRVEEHHSGGVAPWFYEQAAIIHRKRNDLPSELAVLRRFARQPHGAGAKPPKLLGRLTKLETTLTHS